MKLVSSKPLSVLITAVLLTGCGAGDESPSVHLGAVADPDPGTPFFNDQSGFAVADLIAGRFSGMFSSASAVLPEDSLAVSNDRMRRNTLAVATENVACDSGSMSMSLSTNDRTSSIEGASVSFNQCKFDSEVVNGSVSVSGSALDSEEFEGVLNVSFNNLRMAGTETFAIDGDLSASLGTVGSRSTMGLSGSALTISAPGETTTFGNYRVTAIEDSASGLSQLSGGMEFHSSVDGSLSVQVAPALVMSDSAEYPASGKITMTHSDGSSLVIDADNGDAATFSYVINDGSTTVSGNGNWSDLEAISEL